MTEPFILAVGLLSMAGGPPVGNYCHPVKIAAIVLLIIPWLLGAPWVHKDARRVRTHQSVWSLAVLAVGALSILVWLLVPLFLVGILTYAILTATVFIVYLVHRDSRVDAEHKVLTRKSISSLLKWERTRKVEVQTRVKLYTSDGKSVAPPDPQVADGELCETYNRAQELAYDIIWRRASQADLTPSGQTTRVRYVIDGVVTKCPSMELQEADRIIQFLKPLGGMDPEDRRRPQEGKLSVDLAGHQIDITLTTAGTTSGQRMQFRVIQESIRTRLGDLGMDPGTLERIEELNKGGPGLIIVSGRSGSGVTSTLYSLLRAHDAFIRHLVTLESTVEVELENITQKDYGDQKNLPHSLMSMIRRDPDVLMVDSCPDDETGSIIRDIASEKNVLLGMSAGDTFVALARWVRACGDAKEAVGHLKGVLCQVLLRKLCPNCREAYRPDPGLLAKANLTTLNVERFFRPPTTPLTDEKGKPITCPACQGSGYLGRTAAFELLEITDEIRQAVISGASLGDIKKICRRNKMLYLQEHALRKVLEGETSVQEILRVQQQVKKKKKS